MPETFETIFPREVAWLRLRRQDVRPGFPTDVTRPTVGLGLTGLALSGGGVRSASFCLGVLQALDGVVGLKHFDYLSTVSGGGYIGTATTVGLTRAKGSFPFRRAGSDPDETPETQHLRDNSRYLVKDGFPSVMSFLAVYLRGIAMNVVTVLPFMLVAALVLVLALDVHRALGSGQGWLAPLKERSWPVATVLLPLMGLALVGYAVAVSLARIGAQRYRAAKVAGRVLVGIAVLVIVLDLHPLILEAVQAHVAGVARSANETADTGVFGWVWLTASALAPVVALLLPYIKPIAAKAASAALDTWADAMKRLASRVVLLAIALIVPLLLWCCTLQLALWAIGAPCPAGTVCGPEHRWAEVPGWLGAAFDRVGPFLTYGVLAVACRLVWPWLSVNANSLHQLYRDRLSLAFLVSSTEGGTIVPEDEFPLSAVTKDAPYHLINTALNVPGAKEANERGRNADFFLFSPLYIGSRLTGYVPTASAETVVDGLNIGTAMAISGAAAAPNMGMASIRPLSPTIALLNVRLGRWVLHPLSIEQDVRAGRKGKRPGPHYLLREAFAKSGLRPWVPSASQRWTRREGSGGDVSDYVFLTDGGHIENLGVYELLRRRCRLIVVVDGEADPRGKCLSLEQLERFARIDLGTKIMIDVRPIIEATRAVDAALQEGRFPPRKHGPHVALGRIDYPPVDDPEGPREAGVLVYVKASVSGDENDYVSGYKARHRDFPQETTADQLFTEEQLEAYRALGEHAMRRFLAGADGAAGFADDWLALLDEAQSMLPGSTLSEVRAA